MKQLYLTAIIEEAEEGGYVAYLDELRGVITQGETIEEVEENLYDALLLYLKPLPNNVSKKPDRLRVIKKPFISLSRAAWKEETLKNI